ncbi:MAG: DUF262 domain-containing protein [Neisseriales bacterium]|nr:MAG: DUF262 domain-containing protein [Neisseriales bacterium]
MKNYPVPLIMLAKLANNTYEIIDGMQRLNAFFGFIENEFSYVNEENELYFNVDDYTFAKSLYDKDVFKANRGEKITTEEVAKFIQYQFPVTIFESHNPEDVNETFRRINSNGKHLSPQEVRQAGNTSQFANLVRKLSSEIRNDISQEVLLLSQMPSISIDSKNLALGYSILAEEIFWRKHGILNIPGLRNSNDEQFMADIVLSIIYNKPFGASKDTFDECHGAGESNLSLDIEQKLNKFGIACVEKAIREVFAEVITFLARRDDKWRLKNILNPKARQNPVKEAFYILFMAWYELHSEQMYLFNDDMFIEAILNLHSTFSKKGNSISSQERRKNIDSTKGRISRAFKESKNKNSVSELVNAMDVHEYLARSKIETSSIELKQGLLSLDLNVTRDFSDANFEKNIIINIAAIANLGKGRVGRIFLGVTDKPSDTDRVVQIDKIQPHVVHSFSIVGIEREALVLKKRWMNM